MAESVLIAVFLFPGILTFLICVLKQRIFLALLLPWFSWLGLLLSLVASSPIRPPSRSSAAPAQVDTEPAPAAARVPISGMEGAWQAGMILAIIGACVSLVLFTPGGDRTMGVVALSLCGVVAIVAGTLFLRLKWARERLQAQLDAAAKAPKPPPLPGADTEARLADLDALRHRGVITVEEHARGRAKALGIE